MYMDVRDKPISHHITRETVGNLGLPWVERKTKYFIVNNIISFVNLDSVVLFSLLLRDAFTFNFPRQIRVKL